MIPYGRQDISAEDIESVVRILKSEWLTQGPMVPRFENAISKYCNVEFSVATNSATSALHVACLALGVGRGDTVWTSPNTFVASANCALYCGANIDFIDIDPKTYNMCIDSLEEKLKIARINNRLPKVVIPVHFAGQSCDMKKIHALSKEYGFKIIEDASHAIGAIYDGLRVGGCQYSDITVFSFHPVKIITSGEGGMAVTGNPDLMKSMRLYVSHGITNDVKGIENTSLREIWNYQQVRLGFNYRLTDIHAALGLSQLERIDSFLARRKEIAGIYDSRLSKFPIALPYQSKFGESSYHLYPIRVNQESSGKSRLEIYRGLRELKIMANIHYIPVYLQPYYSRLGFSRGHCPEAEKYFQEAISIPIYPALSLQDQIFVINSIKNLISN